MTGMQATTEDARKLMTEGLIALSNASIAGIGIDIEYCRKQKKILQLKLKKLSSQFKETRTGVLWTKVYRNANFNSDMQLRDILFKKLHLPHVKKTEPSETYPDGQPAVDNETLELLNKQNPDLTPYIRYKKYDKVLNTYISGIIKEQVGGFLHPFFHLHTAKTFRSSSANINFQNQPNRDPVQKKIIRTAFIPHKGQRFLTADFSGIEVAISCCNHKDPKMIKYVTDKKTDMHRDLAIDCYKLDKFQKEGAEKTLRKGAKNGFVFPQFYGDYYGNNAPILLHWGGLPPSGTWNKSDGVKLMTGMPLGAHLIKKGITCYEDFQEHIQDVQNHFWKQRFKAYNQWKLDNVKEYYEKGFLKTLTGFTCSGLMGKNEINNYPIQGPAFHCTLFTFIEMSKRIEYQGLKTKLIGQIHDELVFTNEPEEKDQIIDMLRSVACILLPHKWPWIIVPLEIEANVFEVGAPWSSSSSVIKIAK